MFLHSLLSLQGGGQAAPPQKEGVLIPLHFHKIPVKGFCVATFRPSVLRGEREWMWNPRGFPQSPAPPSWPGESCWLVQWYLRTQSLCT